MVLNVCTITSFIHISRELTYLMKSAACQAAGLKEIVLKFDANAASFRQSITEFFFEEKVLVDRIISDFSQHTEEQLLLFYRDWFGKFAKIRQDLLFVIDGVIFTEEQQLNSAQFVFDSRDKTYQRLEVNNQVGRNIASCSVNGIDHYIKFFCGKVVFVTRRFY
jgi:hypothetical protein